MQLMEGDRVKKAAGTAEREIKPGWRGLTVLARRGRLAAWVQIVPRASIPAAPSPEPVWGAG